MMIDSTSYESNVESENKKNINHPKTLKIYHTVPLYTHFVKVTTDFFNNFIVI